MMTLPSDREAKRLEIGQWLLAADEAAHRAMVNRDLTPSEATTAAGVIRHTGQRRAWAALDGLVRFEPARLRVMAEMCWLEEHHASGETAGSWHDAGQKLFEATAALQVAIEAAREQRAAA